MRGVIIKATKGHVLNLLAQSSTFIVEPGFPASRGFPISVRRRRQWVNPIAIFATKVCAW
jgi:hypothetical protein